MKKNKKVLVGLMVAGVAVIAVACGDSSSKTDTKKEEKEKPTTEQVTKKEATGPTDNGDLGKYYVAIQDFTLAQDYNGADVGIVQYEFKNNSDKNAMFMVATQAKVFQNGITLESAILSEDGYNDQSTDIQPGATIVVKVPYKLQDTTTPVSAEVKQSFGIGKDILKKEFTLQ